MEQKMISQPEKHASIIFTFIQVEPLGAEKTWRSLPRASVVAILSFYNFHLPAQLSRTNSTQPLLSQ